MVEGRQSQASPLGDLQVDSVISRKLVPASQGTCLTERKKFTRKIDCLAEKVSYLGESMIDIVGSQQVAAFGNCESIRHFQRPECRHSGAFACEKSIPNPLCIRGNGMIQKPCQGDRGVQDE